MTKRIFKHRGLQKRKGLFVNQCLSMLGARSWCFAVSLLSRHRMHPERCLAPQKVQGALVSHCFPWFEGVGMQRQSLAAVCCLWGWRIEDQKKCQNPLGTNVGAEGPSREAAPGRKGISFLFFIFLAFQRTQADLLDICGMIDR